MNSQPVEVIELGIGRQLGIEDQFVIAPGPFLPELGEAEDLGILAVLGRSSPLA